MSIQTETSKLSSSFYFGSEYNNTNSYIVIWFFLVYEIVLMFRAIGKYAKDENFLGGVSRLA